MFCAFRRAAARAESGGGGPRPCRARHVLDRGATTKRRGPSLYGIAGRKAGGVDGFTYSAGMKKHGGEWTWERLAQFLYDPKAAVPETNMAFAGVKDPAELAALLAFLRTKADTPLAFPAAKK